MHPIKTLSVTLLLVTSLLAEATDTWKINAGSMFVTNFETDMQLSKKGFPLGAKINTQDQLGLKNETAVFYAGGSYRFTDTHSIEANYFSVKSDGNRHVDKAFEWDGDTIEAGANAQSYFNMNTFKINYLYSFYHNDKVELSLSAGLHITSLDVGLSAQGTVNNSPEEKVHTATSVTAPLPVIGFKGEYTILPNTLFVEYKADYFYLKYDTLKGSLVSTSLNLEYQFIKHFGIGAGFNSSTIALELETSDKKVEAENNLNGFLTYLTYRY